MRTKQQLKDKIAKLQAKLDAMPDERVNEVFAPEFGECCHTIKQCPFTGKFEVISWSGSAISKPKNVFRTKEGAEAYAHAFNVLFECHALRDWDGVGSKVFTICAGNSGVAFVDVWMNCSHTMLGQFNTKESAEAAIAKIGEDNIRKAAMTLGRGVV